MSDNAIKSTTQEFLDVYDIVNDMVLLKDGTAAVILQIGTMNFSLLAEQEQDAVIFTYGSLLNSLNYQIQINIQSQTKDATKYLRLLDEQITKASSDRKANLIKKYRDFVAALIKERNVLQKRFYITVPASPGEMGLISASGVLPGKTVFDISTVEKSVLLEKAINILEPRKDHLTSQFNRLGLYVRQLSTQEIIQNFYINYNPEAAEGQEISSSENYTTPLVRASFGGKYMQLNNQQNDTSQIPVVTNAVGATPAVTPTANPVVSQATSPVATYPTPEEILSGETAQPQVSPVTEPVAQSAETVLETPTPQAQQIAEPMPVSPTEQIVPISEFEVSNTAPATIPETIVSEIPPVQQEATQPIETTPEVNLEVNPEISLSLDSNLINTSHSEPNIELPQIFVEEDPTLPTTTVAPEPVAPVQNIAPQEPAIQNAESASDFAEEIMPLQNNFDAQSQGQSPVTEPET